MCPDTPEIPAPGSPEQLAEAEAAALAKEISRLMQAVRQGKLGERADLERFAGREREILRGINAILLAAEAHARDEARRRAETAEAETGRLRQEVRRASEEARSWREKFDGTTAEREQERLELEALRAQEAESLGALQSLAQDIESLAACDLTQETPPAAPGAAAPLSQALARTREALNQATDLLCAAMGQAVETADDIGNAAARALEAGQAFAHGSIDISATAESARRAIKRATARLRAIAEGACEAGAHVAEAAACEVAQAQQAEESTEEVLGLRERQAALRKTVEAMDRIAFEVTILGVNAAIEAARAGKRGRGMEAVAARMQNLGAQADALAEQWFEWLDDTDGRIESLGAMADQSAENARTAQEWLAEAATSCEALRSRAQAEAENAEEADDGLAGLDHIARQRGLELQQTAAALENLVRLAGQLADNLGRYNLPEDGPRHASLPSRGAHRHIAQSDRSALSGPHSQPPVPDES